MFREILKVFSHQKGFPPPTCISIPQFGLQFSQFLKPHKWRSQQSLVNHNSSSRGTRCYQPDSFWLDIDWWCVATCYSSTPHYPPGRPSARTAGTALLDSCLLPSTSLILPLILYFSDSQEIKAVKCY
ncbi:hypothetical protein J6590_043907 [Homalodisca vitripennis]|nr:hypothetical protein J6590_043907 [Homalodisca vitripennis]